MADKVGAEVAARSLGATHQAQIQRDIETMALKAFPESAWRAGRAVALVRAVADYLIMYLSQVTQDPPAVERTLCQCAVPDPVMQADNRFHCWICSLPVPAVLCSGCRGIAALGPPPGMRLLKDLWESINHVTDGHGFEDLSLSQQEVFTERLRQLVGEPAAVETPAPAAKKKRGRAKGPCPRGVCPKCGEEYPVKKDGYLWSHYSVNGEYHSFVRPASLVTEDV